MTKSIIKILSGPLPNPFVNIVFDKLANPQLRKLRERETEVLNTAQKEFIPFKGVEIKKYQWEGEKEGILLIHGWEGQAGNFSDLILKLRKEGFNIFAFDAPSHGFIRNLN